MPKQNETVTVTFPSLPQTLAELKSLPEASLDTPFKTAALTVAALCVYGTNPDECVNMLNFLRGPRPMSVHDVQFLKDRLQEESYKPFSYFEGALPENDYKPNVPYQITVSSGPYTYINEGYAALNLRSGGADALRSVTLREKPSAGQWFLWESSGLLPGIRLPKSRDPWA